MNRTRLPHELARGHGAIPLSIIRPRSVPVPLKRPKSRESPSCSSTPTGRKFPSTPGSTVSSWSTSTIQSRTASSLNKFAAPASKARTSRIIGNPSRIGVAPKLRPSTSKTEARACASISRAAAPASGRAAFTSRRSTNMMARSGSKRRLAATGRSCLGEHYSVLTAAKISGTGRGLFLNHFDGSVRAL